MKKMDVIRNLTRFLKNIKSDIKGPIIVAVSGGPDSVCLLHSLSQIKDKLGIDLHVAHLNHSLRGAEADLDAAYVESLSTDLGLSVTIEKRKIRLGQKVTSVEEAARNLRYEFLSEVARNNNSSHVAIAHTADDQAETILMHIVRGSGIDGLRGMRQISIKYDLDMNPEITIIRPLLFNTREDTENYCNRNNLIARIDSSNKSYQFLRNRFRYELMPLLKKYNPRIRESLLRTSQVVDEVCDYMEQQVSDLDDEVYKLVDHSIIINREYFLRLATVIQKQVIRKSLKTLIGNLTDIEAVHIESIIKAAYKPVGTRVTLPYKLLFVVNYTDYYLGIDDKYDSIPELIGEYNLNIPGEVVIPGWRVISNVQSQKPELNTNSLVGYFDHNKVSQTVIVRGRKPGDKFQPFGMSNVKSLQNFMVDEKIPRNKRYTVPVVCSEGQIVWVVGYRIDDRAKVNKKTRDVLRVEFIRNC
ncbi:MAG: tRNA lysidine(34) synthetase TilS [Chloroflexi bacterium]|nr:tRNA lysidine(34) synthetase TilS [Chloroflexota bacterium]